MNIGWKHAKFIEPLHLRRDVEGHGDDLFVLDKSYCIRAVKRVGEDLWEPVTVCVPAEFGTDLASVPRWARWLISKTDAIEPSIVHDWAYATRSLTRRDADELFLALMEAAGMAWWKRNLMYAAVRVGGGSTYEED